MGMLPAAAPSVHGRLRHKVSGLTSAWNEVGVQAQFYFRTLGFILAAFTRYRAELLRVIAQLGMGTGALAMIGGAIGVFGILLIATGSLIGSQGYSQFEFVGIQALTGLAGAILNIRFIIPATAVVSLSATIGAGATAQLGAMRINEEIDALEVMGINSTAYLASTRVAAGAIVMIPVYSVAVVVGFLSTRFTTTIFNGQATGVYDHYFNAFLNGTDVLISFVSVVVITVIVMLIHTYYGFTATGGPAGVGEAVGRATRNTLVIGGSSLVIITLAVYGQTGNFHLAH